MEVTSPGSSSRKPCVRDLVFIYFFVDIHECVLSDNFSVVDMYECVLSDMLSGLERVWLVCFMYRK